MLAGAERWNADLVTRVIEFELKVAAALPLLLASTAEASGYSDPEAYASIVPSDAPFAVMRAIELAFATDRFGEGKSYSVRLVTDKVVQPRSPMQVVQWACVGAILGLVRIDLGADGAAFSWHPYIMALRQTEPEVSFLAWPSVRSEAKVLIRRLIPAALLNGTILDVSAYDLADNPVPDKRLWSAVETTDEFRVARDIDRIRAERRGGIRGFQVGRPSSPSAAADGLWSMERRWNARLDMLRASAEWDQMMIRSNLLDWSLLALWVSFERYDVAGSVHAPRSPDAEFIRDLARQLTAGDPILEPQF